MTIVRKWFIGIATFLLCIYSFTVLSFQEMIPTLLRQTIVVALPAILIMISVAINLIEKPRIFIEIVPLSLICMELIILLWNNHSIRTEGITSVYSQVIPLLFFFACFRDTDWFPIVIKAMVIFGLIYAVGTYLSVYIPSLYTNTIAPLMKELYPHIIYTQGSVAGFTAHYSTNGMYLANGFMALACVAWTRHNNGKRITLEIVLLVFVAIAFLICGKRGTLLCLVFGTYIAYFLLTKNPKHRILKMIAFTVALVVAIRLVALVIPQVTASYTRTVEMYYDSGDVTTGRLDLWRMAWQAFLQAPLFGHGWRWFLVFSDTGRDVHNCYLQLLTEVGIIGSIPFFIFFVLTYLRTLKLTFLWQDNGLDQNTVALKPNPVLFLLMYQSFFLLFIFEGTGLFNVEVLFPYIACCTMTHVLYQRHKKEMVAMNLYRRCIKACIG